MVFRWLDAEEYDDVIRWETLDEPPILRPVTPREMAVILRNGSEIGPGTRKLIADYLVAPAAKPDRRNRGRPKADSPLLDAEVTCLNIADFLAAHYPGERGIRQRAIRLTVDRLKLYDVRLSVRTLGNYMSRPQGDRRRR